MTDIKYKDDNGWNTYQNMVGCSRFELGCI